jgi:diguanylate cyclase (GGDEF)-like protein
MEAPLAASAGRRGVVVRAWYALAVGGLAVFGLHTIVGFGGPAVDHFFNQTLYNVIVLLAVAGCVLRVVWFRADRGAWLALTVAVAMWATGELLFDFAYGGAPPFPSLADVFYLGFAPACYVGLILLVRGHVSRLSGSVWLDGVMAALAAAAVGSTLLFEAVVDETGGRPAVVVTNLAYPLADILLLALVVGVFALSGWRPGRVWALIGGALVASAIADGIFLYQASAGTYTEGTPLDVLWPASMLLLAAAALQPPSRTTPIELEGRPLLATPAVCGVLAMGVLLYDRYYALHALAPMLSVATLAAVLVRTGLTFRENARILERSRQQAVTDALTGLWNRRKLLEDLERVLGDPATGEHMLVFFDLDGFKHYNDTFGHSAGDAMLSRLGSKLDAVAARTGSSYRLGGDEFCVLAWIHRSRDAEDLLSATAEALSEVGEGFAVSSSFGAVFLPEEATDPGEALRVADQRLYVQKHSTRLGRGQPHEALLQALFEREPDLRGHVREVTDLALAFGRELGLEGDRIEELRLAAQLHDIGKLAIPDAVLLKHEQLDEEEWEFVRQHTVIGQRILGAVPALHRVGTIVRATHERWDGTGYVDGLAGEEIPLAARIIAVCDSYAVMTSDRPYRAAASSIDALAELRRCAGTQFDPELVPRFCELVTRSTLARAS